MAQHPPIPTQGMKSLVKCKKANPSPATKEHLENQHGIAQRNCVSDEVKGREGTLGISSSSLEGVYRLH